MVMIPLAAESDVDIMLSSASGNVTASSTVLLVCVAGGSSTPVISWQFNGNMITNASIKVQLYHSTYKHFLCHQINIQFK